MPEKFPGRFKTWQLFDQGKLVVKGMDLLGIYSVWNAMVEQHTNFLDARLETEMLIKVLRLVFITITANFDRALSKDTIAVVVLEALNLRVPMSQVETISLGVSHMWILDKDDEELVKYVLTPMGGSVVYRAKDQPCL